MTKEVRGMRNKEYMMKKRIFQAVTGVALAAAALASQAQVTGLGNGSFESGLSGWGNQNGTGVTVSSGGAAGQGNSFATIGAGQSIYDSFTPSAGLYQIAFWAWGSGAVSLFNSVDVQNNHWSNPVADMSFSMPTWTKMSFSFNATAGNSYHVFFDGAGTGLKLDGVSIAAAVPEPETYAMLLAGLGVLGFTGRRRMKQG